MKLLIDENVSHRIQKYLDGHFVGSLHVSSIKEGILRDIEIWEYAKEHDFTIVTYDQDFYEWQQLRGISTPCCLAEIWQCAYQKDS